MTKKKEQWYRLTEQQLWRVEDEDTLPGVKEATDRVRKIKELGHKPLICYSEFHGFRIVDEDDPEQFKNALSLEARAKPYSRA